MTDDRLPPAVARLALLAALALAPFAATAQPGAPDGAQPMPGARPAAAACVGLADDRARLECYDRAAGRGAVPMAPEPPTLGAPAAPVQAAEPGPPMPLLDATAKLERDDRRARSVSLGERWELDPGTKQGRFVLRPYKPVYVLPLHWTDNPNQQPTSGGPNNTVPVPLGLSATEATFQFSLKSKVAETIADSNVDLWLAYTQLSHWQVYTPQLSRPFRETNYEPEMFAIWGFDQPLYAGWRARFLGLGLNHQSNGRAEPLSRSWNRIIAQVGLERGDWSVLVRPWWRLQESADVDDNPGIEDYVGRGELVITRRSGAHVASLQLRHSLKGGEASRGSVLLDWAYPLSSFLKGHLQLFSGYGESLIDFNHRQTTIGLGVSLAEWQ